jgi:hypothetical protein
MPTKTNGQKQQLASNQKNVKEQQQQQREKEKAQRDKEKEQRAKEKEQRAKEKEQRAKEKDAAPSSSFEFPSKRKASKSREASPAKVSRDKPQPEIAGEVAFVTPTTTADNAESASLEITITTEGSSSITPKNDKAPAQKTAPEKKGDDSDYGSEEASDDDDDAEEDKLPAARNDAVRAKKDRGRQIKSVMAQGKFTLYTHLHCPSPQPSSSKLLRQSIVEIPLGHRQSRR